MALLHQSVLSSVVKISLHCGSCLCSSSAKNNGSKGFRGGTDNCRLAGKYDPGGLCTALHWAPRAALSQSAAGGPLCVCLCGENKEDRVYVCVCVCDITHR